MPMPALSQSHSRQKASFWLIHVKNMNPKSQKNCEPKELFSKLTSNPFWNTLPISAFTPDSKLFDFKNKAESY